MLKRILLSPNDDPLKNSAFFKGLQYPYLVSPKLDGIRGVVVNKTLRSRTMLLLPSLQAQREFAIDDLNFVDGEVIAGREVGTDVYNRTQSHVMSVDKPGDLTYRLFDFVHPDFLAKPFHERFDQLARLRLPANVSIVRHELAESYEDLLELENIYLQAGYEGVMLRNPLASYKQGRATYNENIIYKLKRFEDGEGCIIGFYEAMMNNNVKETDIRGYAKRSGSQAGLIAGDTLGGFYVEFDDQILRVPPGSFSHAQRKEIWDKQDRYLSKWLKFRFMRYGIKDKPRHPRALGFRDKMDFDL